MRASWKGNFRIGDVIFPVKLYSATRSIAPHFTQLDSKDRLPVKRVAISSKDGRQLKEDEIIKAVEYEGKMVELGEDELELHSNVERDVVVRQITDPSGIDPIYYDSPYYLIPDKDGELAFSILRRAFEKTNKVAISTLLFYGRERLAAISSRAGVMYLQTLHFHEEIVPKTDIRMPALPRPAPAQIAIASKLLEHHSLPFYASDFRSQQMDLLKYIIERKSKGLPLKKYKAVSSGATPEEEVMDKMQQMLQKNPQEMNS